MEDMLGSICSFTKETAEDGIGFLLADLSTTEAVRRISGPGRASWLFALKGGASLSFTAFAGCNRIGRDFVEAREALMKFPFIPYYEIVLLNLLHHAVLMSVEPKWTAKTLPIGTFCIHLSSLAGQLSVALKALRNEGVSVETLELSEILIFEELGDLIVRVGGIVTRVLKARSYIEIDWEGDDTCYPIAIGEDISAETLTRKLLMARLFYK